jgi:hypothetical protein
MPTRRNLIFALAMLAAFSLDAGTQPRTRLVTGWYPWEPYDTVEITVRAC